MKEGITHYLTIITTAARICSEKRLIGCQKHIFQSMHHVALKLSTITYVITNIIIFIISLFPPLAFMSPPRQSCLTVATCCHTLHNTTLQCCQHHHQQALIIVCHQHHIHILHYVKLNHCCCHYKIYKLTATKHTKSTLALIDRWFVVITVTVVFTLSHAKNNFHVEFCQAITAYNTLLGVHV